MGDNAHDDNVKWVASELARRGPVRKDVDDPKEPPMPALPTGTFFTDFRSGEQLWSPRMWDLLDLDPEDGVTNVVTWMQERVDEPDLTAMMHGIQTLNDGGTVRQLVHARRRDGTVSALEFVVAAVFDEQGQAVGASGAVRRVEPNVEQVIERGARLRVWDEIAAQFPFYIAVVDDDEHVTYVNRSMLGMPRDALIGHKLAERFDDVLLREVRACFAAVRDGEPTARFSYTTRAEDVLGEGHTLTVQVAPLVDERNQLHAFVVAATDISREVQIQKALQESEERYRSVYENSGRGIALHNGRGFTFINPTCRKLWGLGPDDDVPVVFELVHPEDHHIVKRRMKLVLGGNVGQPEEIRFNCLDGVERTLSVTGVPVTLHDHPHALVEFLDVTEVRKAEERRRQAEQKYRALVEHSNDVVFILDDKQRETWRSPQTGACRALSFAGLVDNLDEKSRDRLANALAHVDGRQLLHLTGVFDNRRQFFACEVSPPIPDVEGRVVSLRDITEEHGLETELHRLGQVLEQVEDGVYTTDVNGVILDVNKAYAAMTGYPPDELRGKPFRVLRSGVHDDAFYAGMWNPLLRGETWAGRVVNKRKDGSLYTEEGEVSPVLDDDGAVVGFIGIKRDISKALLLEEQLRQAQKMDGLGQLAGGVAHDFNNLLTLIMGASHLLGLSDLDDEQLLELATISKAAERAESLTQQLLAFSRRQVLHPEDLNAVHAVRDAESMLGRLLPSEIRISHNYDAADAMIHVDRGQLEQVLMNLLINAKDAMPTGGHLRLGVTLRQPNRARTNVTYACIEVADDGEGMDSETASKIFEPFFTTKDPGKGTGLGLSTVYGIVRQSEGDIEVVSVVGQGTTFRVYFPVVNVDHTSTLPQQSQEPDVLQQDVRVLLVEDDPGVRRVAERLLARMGCDVIVAKDAEDAVHKTEDIGLSSVQLLVTDVVMPGRRGPELARELIAQHPELQVLFISGYTEGELTASDLARGHFLRKPFSPAQLSDAVQEALSGKVYNKASNDDDVA